jgi:hypothetical protein
MCDIKIDFSFTWFKGMPERGHTYPFHYVDGETYDVDVLGHISGKFVLADDIHAWFPSHQRLHLTGTNLEELRNFSVQWGKNIIDTERVEFFYDSRMEDLGISGYLLGKGYEDSLIENTRYIAKTKWGEHKDTGKPMMVVEIFGKFKLPGGNTFATNEGQCDNGWAIPGLTWDKFKVLDIKWKRIR